MNNEDEKDEEVNYKEKNNGDEKVEEGNNKIIEKRVIIETCKEDGNSSDRTKVIMMDQEDALSSLRSTYSEKITEEEDEITEEEEEEILCTSETLGQNSYDSYLEMDD